jgi:hypothetical protein
MSYVLSWASVVAGKNYYTNFRSSAEVPYPQGGDGEKLLIQYRFEHH